MHNNCPTCQVCVYVSISVAQISFHQQLILLSIATTQHKIPFRSNKPAAFANNSTVLCLLVCLVRKTDIPVEFLEPMHLASGAQSSGQILLSQSLGCLCFYDLHAKINQLNNPANAQNGDYNKPAGPSWRPRRFSAPSHEPLSCCRTSHWRWKRRSCLQTIVTSHSFDATIVLNRTQINVYQYAIWLQFN
jgi:hypothetical protein